jgi:hypothetical protein
MAEEPVAQGRYQFCDCCGETAVVESICVQEFQYGAAEEAAMLSVLVPMLSCWSCGIQYTDHRGEQIRDQTVIEHVGTAVLKDTHEGDDDMNREDLEKSADRIRGLNRLWRDPEARRRFEEEAGLVPIRSGSGPEVDAERQSGKTEEYHERFVEWASAQV